MLIERTFRGIPPAPTITAPDDIDRLRDNHDPSLAKAYFKQSENTRNGNKPDFREYLHVDVVH